jgi:hypothetical protein
VIREELEIKMEGNYKEQEAKHVIYHAVFGMYKEDLSILSQITGCTTWYTREELRKWFQKMTTHQRSQWL